MRGNKVFVALCMVAIVLTGCNKQESAAEEVYAKETSWIVKNEQPAQNEEEKAKKAGNQISDVFQIHFMDVGQGDAALIVCDGHAMLIDAGDNTKGTYVQNYLQKMNISYLDMAIATHPDADHIGGMDVILQKFDCGKLLLPDVVKDTKTYEDLVRVIEDKYVNAIHPYTGDSYALGTAQISILSPCRDDYEDVNDFSIVCKITYGNTSFLFAGDATETVEEEMLQNNIDISADVLKVGHHGSKTSSGDTFIRAVGAGSAIISCGENNEYGQPAASTLNTLRSYNTDVYRTDEQGTIILYSDGDTITFNCKPSETWQSGEYTGQNQSQEAADGSSYNKYENPQAFLKFQYEGKDKEAYKQMLEQMLLDNEDKEKDTYDAEEDQKTVQTTGKEDENTEQQINSVPDEAKEAAATTAQKAADSVDDVKNKASQAANTTKEKVKDTAADVTGALPGTATKIGKAVIKANVEYWNEEYCPPNYGNIEDTMRIAKSAMEIYKEME